MNDPLRSQMLMQDALEFLVHERIMHKTSSLNLMVTPINPQQRDIGLQFTESKTTRKDIPKDAVKVNNQYKHSSNKSKWSKPKNTAGNKDRESK